MNAMIIERFLYTSPVNMGVWNTASNCLLQMEKEAQNTLINKALPVHVNSSSFIISPNSLFVSANQNEHKGPSILSSDWQVFCVPIPWALDICNCVAFFFILDCPVINKASEK